MVVMKNILEATTISLAALLLMSCTSVQQQTLVSTPEKQQMTVGIGDVVLRVEGRESLPNVFGKADLFGRTRPTGFTTINFNGMQGDKVMLLRSGVTTQSDATTMNSTGMIVPTSQNTNFYGSVGTTPISGTASTQSQVYIPPTGSTILSMQNQTIQISVNWKVDPRIFQSGKTIVIDNANSLTYHVE